MTQEEKQLLLKDLCARLPYHPIVSVAYNYADKGIVWGFDVLRIKLLLEIEEEESWEYIKPYLRPMSSMTEEEKVEYGDRCYFTLECINANQQYYFNELYDWLNAHHFDYRGLIERGLAIAISEDNNPYKE